ncbi:hypothetical protein QTI66_19295 [Variovorax sp. J22R133]|uniref:hypothetical protein n=1 Tax=Variovorax brevis TaxID=3053503 RepID=UPI002577C764|nr:hypothetical protein [Variovorax sp. J22R133]MDM0114308.1 hypothetical protein [Variovorax sp. J22R133]
MHNAPSVTYPVGRSRNAIRLVLGLWLLGACGVCAWCWGQSAMTADAWCKPAALLGALMMAAWGAWRSVRLGEGLSLHWDGQHWSAEAGASLRAARATVHLDFQSLMLVRLAEPDRNSVWVWLERAAMPQRWLDVRRALHAQVSMSETGQGIEATNSAGRMDSASVP